MNPFTVSKAFLGFLVGCIYLTSVFSQQLQTWSGLNYQIVWAGIGSMMLAFFFNVTVLLYRVLVRGQEHLQVKTILRESGLYQMETLE